MDLGMMQTIVGNAATFCSVGSRGSTLITNASTEIGIRPSFAIYQA